VIVATLAEADACHTPLVEQESAEDGRRSGRLLSPARKRLSRAASATRAVLTSPDVRRLELAWSGFVVGEWVHVVALFVFAYDAGGPSGVGIVTIMRMLPAAVAAPFGSLLADMYSRERVMISIHLARASTMSMVVVALLLDAPPVTIYLIVAVAALVSAVYRPAQWAVLPSLVHTPEELIAGNVAYATIEGVGTLVGPAVGGVLVTVADRGVAFGAAACLSLWAALLTSRIKTPDVPAARQKQDSRSSKGAFAGFRTIATQSHSRLLIGLFGAQTFVRGALSVLIVVAALDLLRMGESGVGWLNAALGAGGLVGGLGALSLAGRQKLASPFGAGLVLWGLPILLIGIWPEPIIALGLLAVVGGGNALVDVAGLTLLQRTVADHVLGRVLGVLESLALGTIGLGGIIAPVMITQLGVQGALVSTGLVLPGLTALFWRSLKRIDERAIIARKEVSLLRAIPMFAPLSLLMVERVASSLRRMNLETGAQVFRQGDVGDRFYIISDGEIEITVDGGAARTLRAGDYFGEIALLRDVPRTGTATARSEVTLFALEGEDFVSAVTGHPESVEAADAVIGARLSRLAPRIA
jgi:hypothetical protein